MKMFKIRLHAEVFKCFKSMQILLRVPGVNQYRNLSNYMQYMDNQKKFNYHENCDVVMGANIHFLCVYKSSFFRLHAVVI